MNDEIENYIYEKYINKLIKTTLEKKYILNQDIDNLKLNENEKLFFYSILKNKNIEVVDQLTENFDEKDFGNYKSSESESYQVAKKAVFDYAESGALIKEDYSKLEQFLEERFIPNNVIMTKRKKNKLITDYNEEKEKDFWGYSRASNDSKYKEICPTIQLSKIINLNLSDNEVEYVFSYLKKRGIIVRGKNSTYDQDFENFDYYSTYKNQILPTPLSTNELETKVMLYKTTKDPVIKEQIILSNLRMVPYIAWRYSVIYNMPMEELESYGYEGLIESVDKYDPNKGTLFSTYAFDSIRWKIKNGIFTFSNSTNKNWSISYYRCKNLLENLTGKKLENDPNMAYEISELMFKEIDEKLKTNPNYTPVITISNDPEIRKQQVYNNTRRIMFYNQENIDDYSYNEEYEEDIELDNNNYYELESSLNLETLIYSKELKEQIHQILDTLSPNEKKVLMLRYGLEDGKPKDAMEVAKILGMTRDRVIQIEIKAIRKFRYPSRSQKVREFYKEEIIDIEKIDEISSTLRH